MSDKKAPTAEDLNRGPQPYQSDAVERFKNADGSERIVITSTPRWGDSAAQIAHAMQARRVLGLDEVQARQTTQTRNARLLAGLNERTADEILADINRTAATLEPIPQPTVDDLIAYGHMVKEELACEFDRMGSRQLTATKVAQHIREGKEDARER